MYRTAKHFTSVVYHVGLAILSGGMSLPFTLGISSMAHIARGTSMVTSFDHNESGNSVEAEYVDTKLDNMKNTRIAEIGLGVATSLWQAATRPMAWTGIAAATVLDGIGYAGKALVSVPMGMSEDGDEKLEEYWDKEARRNFRWLNTARDFFWSMSLPFTFGSIAPSLHSADVISKNSMLGISDRRMHKAGIDTCNL